MRLMIKQRGNPRVTVAADRFAEAIWTEHIHELYRRGVSHEAIAQELNRRKVPTYAGKRWHRQTVTRLIDRILKRRSGSSGDGESRRPPSMPQRPEDLLRRALAGHEPSQEALIDLLGRARAGEANARKTLLGLIGMSLAELEERPTEDLRPELRGYLEFRARLKNAMYACDSREPWDRESLLHEAARWGWCAQAQALGLVAQSHRMSRDFEAAEECLRLAAVIAHGCESCLADVDRRWVFLLLALGLYTLALGKADASVNRYEALGHSGHDLDGAGLAKALLARGQARWYLGEYSESAREFETCLAMLSHEDHEVLYLHVTVALAAALKECGPERQKEAVGLVNGVRKARFLRRHHRDSPHLARLNWLEGTLKYKLRIGQPCRARDLVEDALRIFIARDMPDEAPAVLADLSMMAAPRWDAKYPDRGMVVGVLKKFEPAVSALSLRPPVRTGLVELRKASWVHGWDAHKGMVAAIRSLREAASGSGVLPGFV